MQLGGAIALAAALVGGCVSGDDTSDAATQGSLGGPCFANNTCNTNLVCVLVNGKGVCQQGDASVQDVANDTTTSEGGSDAPQDVAGDVAPADAGCEASVTAQPACFGNCTNSGELCCPLNGQCYQSGCPVNCNNTTCWSCSSGSDCNGQFCCAQGAAIQPTCPPTASVDVNNVAFCTTTCGSGLFLCATKSDCPSTAPTCVGANVSGIAHSTIGICQ